MADRKTVFPTPGWRWPGEAADAANRAAARDAGSEVVPAGTVDQLRRDRDELVAALEAWQSAADVLRGGAAMLTKAGALAGAYQRAAEVLARIKGTPG